MIMVLVHSTLIEIATSVLKLFVGQGSVTDGRTKRRIHPSPFSEFAKKKTVVKNPLLCLFRHVLTNIQLNFKTSEINEINSLGFEATEHLRNRMRKENCRQRL